MSWLSRFVSRGRRSCSILIARILSRHFLSLMYSQESSLRQRILEDWVQQRLRPTLKVLLPGDEEQVLEITVSHQQAEQLKALQTTPAWLLYLQRLEEVTEQGHRWLLDAESPDEFRYRKGYLIGHLKTRQVLEVLISQSEIGDEQWAQAQLQKMGHQAREAILLTGSNRAGEPTQLEEPVETSRDRIRRMQERLGLTDPS